MKSDWPIVKLRDYVELTTGFPFKSREFFCRPGIRLARGDNVKRGFLDWGQEKTKYWEYITPDLEKYSLKEGDILIGMDGSRVGENWACVLLKDLPCLLVQRVARLRSKESLDQNYLRYIICNSYFTAFIKAIHTGTSIPHISGNQILDYEFALPPLKTQQKIASILGALDEKIEVNKRMNQTLENIAQSIFKSWFINFDPVFMKSEGKQPMGMDEENAKIFPRDFIKIDGKQIPKGWKITNLEKVVEMIKGRSYTSEELTESDIAMVTLKSFLRGGGYRPDGLKPFVGPYKPEQVVKPKELVISFTDVTQAADIIGKPALVSGNPEFSTLVASLDVGIIRPKNNSVTTPFLYLLLKTADYQAHIYGYTTGTTVLHLDKSGIPKYEFIIPSIEVMEEFTKIVSPLLDLMESNSQQVSSLTNIRENLLPKIISGKLCVHLSEGSCEVPA